jgi:hypothetical protein
MRQRHITIATRTGSPRTKRFVIGSLGIVLTVTATGGMAMAGRSSHYAPVSDATDITGPIGSKEDDQPVGKRSAGSISNSSATSTNSTSTQVSINGETIQVNGDGSYNRVYTTDGGRTNVNISVHNSSSSTSGDIDGKEEAMD